MKTSVLLLCILIICILFCCSPTTSSHNALSQKKHELVDSSNFIDSIRDYLRLGNELMHHESLGPLKLGLNIKDLLQILGHPSKESLPDVYQADGRKHKILSYNKDGVELNLVQGEDSIFSICNITIVYPCKFKTQNGIEIGSDYDNVMKAYQNYIDRKKVFDDEIVAGSIYGGIVFKFKNRKIISVFIGAAAE